MSDILDWFGFQIDTYNNPPEDKKASNKLILYLQKIAVKLLQASAVFAGCCLFWALIFPDSDKNLATLSFLVFVVEFVIWFFPFLYKQDKRKLLGKWFVLD